MNNVTVHVREIDFQDNYFAPSPVGEVSKLADSIKEMGLIHLPVLRRIDGGYQIICGHRRLSALLHNGADSLEARVYGRDEVSDFDCLMLAYHENRERLGDMERARLLIKMKQALNLSEEKAIEQILPTLDIAPTRKNYDRYLGFASLGEDILEAYYSGKITAEQASLLAEAEPISRDVVFEKVLLVYRLNTNETREALREIPKAAGVSGKSVEGMIGDIESEIKTRGDKNAFIKTLKRLRYPELSRVEAKYRERVNKLGLPGRVNIAHAPYFEGDYLNITIRVEQEQQLEEAVNRFSELIEDGSITAIFQLIRRGE